MLAKKSYDHVQGILPLATNFTQSMKRRSLCTKDIYGEDTSHLVKVSLVFLYSYMFSVELQYIQIKSIKLKTCRKAAVRR